MVRLAQMDDEGKLADHHASLAKAFCTAKSRETVSWGRELLGGNGIVAFGAALALAWYSAATLFMLFAGILFGVFLTAMADLLRVFGGNQTLRLVIVCLLFTGLLSGVVVLGGATIAQQATALSTKRQKNMLQLR